MVQWLDSEFSLLRAQVQSLVRKLRSLKPHSTAQPPPLKKVEFCILPPKKKLSRKRKQMPL